MTPTKLASAIGLSRRAGKLVIGTPAVCLSLRENPKPCLVLVSETASDATREKVTRKCAFYGVPVHVIPLSTDMLAHTVGKTGDTAAVAVTDPNLAKAVTAAELTGKDGSPAKDPKQ